MDNEQSLVLKPLKPVGLMGYGAYLPQYRIEGKEISRIWTVPDAAAR